MWYGEFTSCDHNLFQTCHAIKENVIQWVYPYLDTVQDQQ